MYRHNCVGLNRLNGLKLWARDVAHNPLNTYKLTATLKTQTYGNQWQNIADRKQIYLLAPTYTSRNDFRLGISQFQERTP